jgi:hypothetical protein
MMRVWKTAAVVLGSLAVALAVPAAARAQYVVYSPPVYYSPPVVTTSYYAAPVTTYYAAPVTAYYAPAPVVSYYAPVTVYSPPAVVGSYTTRSYVGYGIFRPRGVYTESYYAPTVVRPSYYRPVFGW